MICYYFMPGGKVHGQGGHGRYGRELQRGFEHRERAREVLERQQEKNKRKKERSWQEITESAAPGMRQKLDALIVRLESKLKRKEIKTRNYARIYLAMNEWYVEQLEAALKKKGLHAENVFEEHQRELGVRVSSLPVDLMAELLGNNPSVLTQKQLREEIDKWKKRMPKLLEGEY